MNRLFLEIISNHCKFWTIGSFFWSAVVLADQVLVPYASVAVEHNSNVFALSGREQAFSLDSDRTLADTMQRYLVGIDQRLTWGSQSLSLGFEGRHLDFDHFSRLDHNEYLAKGHLTIQMSDSLNSTLDYRQEQRMAAFIDRNSTMLTIEHERTGNGGLNLRIDPEWRWETSLQLHDLDSPLPGFPHFSIKEKSADTAIKYLGVNFLTTGIELNYISGRFDGVSDSGIFRQESLSMTADYSRSELSRIKAQLGYTVRQNDNSNEGNAVALTGLLGYHREITGKTSMDVKAFRRVDSYVGGEGSVNDTGATANVNWHITDRTSLIGDYQWSHTRFIQSPINSLNQNRRDESRTATMRLTNRILPWLFLRPYCSYQVRDSNINIDRFSATIVGIDLQARFERPSD